MSDDDIVIRPIEEDDGDNGLFDVLAQLTEAPKLPRADFVRLLQQQHKLDIRLTVVAVDRDARVIATGSAIIEQKFIRGGRSCGHIEDIVVDKGARGRHLGIRIIEFLINFCKQRDCYKVILDCADNNIPFYEKCGFSPKERQMVLYL